MINFILALGLSMLMVADAADASEPMLTGFVERPAVVAQSVNASLNTSPARVNGLDNPDNVIDMMYRSTFKIDDANIDDAKVTADELIAAVYWAVRMGDAKNPTPSDIKSITMSDTALTLCTKTDVSNPPKNNVDVSAPEDCDGVSLTHYTANTQCLQDIRDHIRLSRESPGLPRHWNVLGGHCVDVRVACLQLQVQQLRDSLRASLAQQDILAQQQDILAQRQQRQQTSNNLKALFGWCSRD